MPDDVTGPGRYRSRPVVVEALRWMGGDYRVLNLFCGQNWTRADARDMDMHDDEGVIVFNSLSDAWLPVHVGEWIVRGTSGELYPCNATVFADCYELISRSGRPATDVSNA